jgi:hypothetical protein
MKRHIKIAVAERLGLYKFATTHAITRRIFENSGRDHLGIKRADQERIILEFYRLHFGQQQIARKRWRRRVRLQLKRDLI